MSEGQKKDRKGFYTKLVGDILKVGWRLHLKPFFFFGPHFWLMSLKKGTLCSGEFGGFVPDSDYEKILEFHQIPWLPNFC